MRHSKNIMLFALAVLVSLLLAEGVARFATKPAVFPREPQVAYDKHPVRAFTLRPNQKDVYTVAAQVITDSMGFRTDSMAEMASGTKILALGDSFTFGYGVSWSETWPANLQKLLQQTVSYDITVVNAGTVSYGVF